MPTQKAAKVAKVTKAAKPTAQKSTGLTLQLVNIQGKPSGTLSLSKDIFGQKPNSKLLAQAYRVYFARDNQRMAHTKTRGEIRGGGKKPHRQKGTGRARAGSIRSPLWVGGGITFGPRYHKLAIALPQKIKQKSLALALSQKVTDGSVKVITNLEGIAPKTKVIASLFSKLGLSGKTLLVISAKNKNVKLAVRNLPNLTIETVQNLSAYKVLKNANLIFSKEAAVRLK